MGASFSARSEAADVGGWITSGVRTRRPTTSEGVGRGASYLQRCREEVAGDREVFEHAGSPFWFPWLPRAVDACGSPEGAVGGR